MAQKDDKDPGAHSKQPGKGPLFIQKRPIDEGEQKELITNVLKMNENLGYQCENWETASDAFSRVVEISIARIQAHVQQAKEKGADSINVTPEEARGSEDSTIPDIDDEKYVTKSFHKKWSDDLKKTVRDQRQKARKWVTTWIKYLHRFDYKEPPVEPSTHFMQRWESSSPGLMILFCVIGIISSFWLKVAMKCEKGFLPCLFEVVLEFLAGVYNLFLTMHNITIVDAGNAQYWITSSDNSV